MSNSLLTFLRMAHRVGESAPKAAKLAAAVARARRGDQGAMRYLRDEGWADGLDIFVRPGAGEAGKTALQHVRDAYQVLRSGIAGDIIEGEAHELDGPPWADFLRHLRCLSSGAIAIFGARGEGKTTLALKLAFVLAQRNLYPVYCVNFDPDDVPEWAERLSLQQVTAEVRMIGRWLNPPPPEEPGNPAGGEVTVDPSRPGPKPERPVSAADIERISGRIVIFDEASLGFGQFAPGGRQTARATVVGLMNFCRHIDTIVIFVGQMIKQLPKDLRTDTVMLYKRPDPEIERQDGTGDDNAYCRQRWADVKAAFADIPNSGWYAGDYANLKAWAYVAAGKIGGHSYYGPVCFTPAPKTLVDADLYVPPEAIP